MTNKEYLLKYLSEHEERLIGMASAYSCVFCDDIGLRTYCHNTDGNCSETIESWLAMEHEETLLFSIGTIVEVTDNMNGDNSKHTGYYNGYENGKHYVSHYRHFINCRYADGELYGGRYDAYQIRKVGD